VLINKKMPQVIANVIFLLFCFGVSYSVSTTSSPTVPSSWYLRKYYFDSQCLNYAGQWAMGMGACVLQNGGNYLIVESVTSSIPNSYNISQTYYRDSSCQMTMKISPIIVNPECTAIGNGYSTAEVQSAMPTSYPLDGISNIFYPPSDSTCADTGTVLYTSFSAYNAPNVCIPGFSGEYNYAVSESVLYTDTTADCNTGKQSSYNPTCVDGVYTTVGFNLAGNFATANYVAKAAMSSQQDNNEMVTNKA